jgi:GT2 family glycosyltransferase
VAVVILNRNRRDDTLACIASVKASTFANFLILLLDNASDDGTPAAVREHAPDVTVIETGGNLGYAAGNNIGLNWAREHRFEYAFLLNEDTIVAPDCIERLVETAEANLAAAFLGPLVYHFSEPNVIQSAGGVVTGDWRVYHRGQNQQNRGAFIAVDQVDWVTGCSILISVRSLDRVGLMDPSFFIYSEEVEWCLRARKAGFIGLFVPSARIWHKGVQRDYNPSPRVVYLSTRNHLLMLKKHKAGAGPLANALAGDLRTLASWSIRPRWRHKRPQRNALARAVLDFWLGRSGPPPI